jgi:hypothetical protein
MITPEAPPCEDPWQKGLDPPLDEMVLRSPRLEVRKSGLHSRARAMPFALAQGVPASALLAANT